MIDNVPKIWSGATVAILAGGPSLRAQNLAPVFADNSRVKVLTVNDSWRLLPSRHIVLSKLFMCGQCKGRGEILEGPEESVAPCDLCFATGKCSAAAMYFCDASWWQNSMASNRRTQDNTYSFHDVIYKGWWFTGAPGFDAHPQVNSLHLTGQLGLECEPNGLRHGSNSGYQAINLTYNMGAKKIILLGYDMHMDGGRSNWHDEARPLASPDVYRQTMLPHFQSLVRPLREHGVTIVNATPGSALECFTKMSLEDALA